MSANRYGYLVLGAESSGTRATARLLEAAGCRSVAIVGDDDAKEQPLDGHPPLITRSVRRGQDPGMVNQWRDIRELLELLDAERVLAIVTMRDWFAMARSQAHRRRVPSIEEAYRNMSHAYKVIFLGLAAEKVPYVVSSYESLVGRPGYSEQLLTLIGLPPASVSTLDGVAERPT